MPARNHIFQTTEKTVFMTCMFQTLMQTFGQEPLYSTTVSLGPTCLFITPSSPDSAQPLAPPVYINLQVSNSFFSPFSLEEKNGLFPTVHGTKKGRKSQEMM